MKKIFFFLAQYQISMQCEGFSGRSWYPGYEIIIASHRIPWGLITYPCPRKLLIAPMPSLDLTRLQANYSIVFRHGGWQKSKCLKKGQPWMSLSQILNAAWNSSKQVSYTRYPPLLMWPWESNKLGNITSGKSFCVYGQHWIALNKRGNVQGWF